MRLILAPLLMLMLASRAQVPLAELHVGDAYEVTVTRDSQQHGTDGSSGSSHDQDTVIERVIGVRSDGVELEYDLPANTPKEERSSTWQFPVRVFKSSRGPPQLLDRPELVRRADAWLKAAKLPQSACGRLVLTWNASRIECNPDAVIKTVEAFELPSDIREGARYSDPNARAPGTLVKKNGRPDGATFTTKMEVDPDLVRRGRAEIDVGVGEILNKPLTFEAALAKHASETISGTISVDFEVDGAGQVWRRTTVTAIEIHRGDGQTETNTNTATLERRRLTH